MLRDEATLLDLAKAIRLVREFTAGIEPLLPSKSS